MLSAALLAVTVAFPSSGTKLPYLKECHMIGAVPRGVTNLVIQGKAVDIYRTGAWVTMLDLVEGTNAIEIVANGVSTNHLFKVGFKPAPPPPVDPNVPVATNQPPAKVYEKLAFAADTPVPHPRVKKPSETVIYLDPGHGGSDTGSLSPHRFPEKDANLRVAREVRKALEAKGYQVRMTRDADTTVELYERPVKAHAEKADAFVSIHHNAPGYATDPRKSRYHTVYSWNPIGDALAKAINLRMAEALDGDIPSSGANHANYAVTRSPEIPSCLIEVDFLTTPEGEEACWDHLRRRKIGEAIAAGIEDWCRGPSEDESNLSSSVNKRGQEHE